MRLKPKIYCSIITCRQTQKWGFYVQQTLYGIWQLFWNEAAIKMQVEYAIYTLVVQLFLQYFF